MKRHIWKKVFVLVLLAVLLLFGYSKGRAKLRKYRLRNTFNVAKIKAPVLEDKPFVVVVASYKNEEFARKNLTSIFRQTHPNYRVIYIDDCSPDHTYDAVREITAEYRMESRVKLIRNEENQGALANLYNHIHTCNPNEIVVVLDGDDWFANDNVLAKLNAYYANRKTWMTYGHYLYYPSYERGVECQPMSYSTLKKGTARSKPWVSSHLRTFYAGLFHKIKREDLMFDGKFFPTTYDLAIMYPMIEMAREHCCYTPDIFYIYNCDTPINDYKVRRSEQMFFEKYIRDLKVYPRLRAHPAQE